MHGLGLRMDPTATRPQLVVPRLLAEVPLTVNKKLDLPVQYREHYDQGAEGACVGFGFSWMMSILNRRRYDPLWLYHEAQKIDPWPDTPPGDGTSEVSGAEILIGQGHRRVFRGSTRLPELQDGIASVQWANPNSPVDELRACVANGVPFGMAIPWFSDFDSPVWTTARGWVIGEKHPYGIGSIRGWHFICSFGARDKYDAFDLVNTWGYDYPLVKIPYRVVEYLGKEYGAAFAVVVDR